MSAIVQELVACGVPDDEIERFLAQWGGTPLYIPAHVAPEHPLVRLAGPSVASALARRYGGERILVPLGARWRRIALRRRVLELRAAGLSAVEVARRLGLHLRQVQRLMHEHG